MNTLWIIVFLLTAYMVGSIPFGWFIVKKRTGKDIRTIGSGKIGATNVTREIGKEGGRITLLLDTLKGFTMGALGLFCFKESPWFSFIIGSALLLVVFGHRFSIILAFFPFPQLTEDKPISGPRLFLRRFNGGSGVACYLGFILPIITFCLFTFVHPWTYIGFISLPVGWLIVNKTRKRMSLSSLSLLVFTIIYFMGMTMLTPFAYYAYLTVFIAVVAYFIAINHWKNLFRLWKGKEPTTDLF